MNHYDTLLEDQLQCLDLSMDVMDEIEPLDDDAMDFFDDTLLLPSERIEQHTRS